eukprot:6593747-Prymnesium_polylepis.2
MLPARNSQEFELFPKQDVAFVQQWLAWADEHVELLKHTKVVPHLAQPSAGALDGTFMVQSGGHGYLFAFNPSASVLPLVVPLNASLGIDCKGTPMSVRFAGSSARNAPSAHSLGFFDCGSAPTFDVPPTTGAAQTSNCCA